jgi:hypothetical protein
VYVDFIFDTIVGYAQPPNFIFGTIVGYTQPQNFIFGTIIVYAQPQNFNPYLRDCFVNGSFFEKNIRYEMCFLSFPYPASSISYNKCFQQMRLFFFFFLYIFSHPICFWSS